MSTDPMWLSSCGHSCVGENRGGEFRMTSVSWLGLSALPTIGEARVRRGCFGGDDDEASTALEQSQGRAGLGRGGAEAKRWLGVVRARPGISGPRRRGRFTVSGGSTKWRGQRGQRQRGPPDGVAAAASFGGDSSGAVARRERDAVVAACTARQWHGRCTSATVRSRRAKAKDMVFGPGAQQLIERLMF